jgi:hypothetical protein
MRMVQSRMRMGTPFWYNGLLEGCIAKIKSILTNPDFQEALTDYLETFINIQKNIPELTVDTIYDGYIKLKAMIEEIENNYPNYIKKGKYKKIAKVQKPFVTSLYNKYSSQLDLRIIENRLYGTNFSFIGTSDGYFFPAVLYSTIYKKNKERIFEITKFNSLLDLQHQIFINNKALMESRIGIKTFALALSNYLISKNWKFF